MWSSAVLHVYVLVLCIVSMIRYVSSIHWSDTRYVSWYVSYHLFNKNIAETVIKTPHTNTRNDVCIKYVSWIEVISLDASIEQVCNISNMTFQKLPLAFRAGQFVDNSADNLTLQCRDYDTYRYTVTLTLGLWQQITSLRLVPKVITVTMIRVIHPHHNAYRRWRASVSNLRWKMTHWKRYRVTDAGPNRRHKLSLTDPDCVSVKFGGRNISIATLLFPRRLQLSCTRRLTGNIYPRSLFLQRHFRFFKLFRSYRTHA